MTARRVPPAGALAGRRLMALVERAGRNTRPRVTRPDQDNFDDTPRAMQDTLPRMDLLAEVTAGGLLRDGFFGLYSVSSPRLPTTWRAGSVRGRRPLFDVAPWHDSRRHGFGGSRPVLQIVAYVGGGTVALARGASGNGRRVITVEKGGAHPSHSVVPSADTLADLGDVERHGVAAAVTVVPGTYGGAAEQRMLPMRYAARRLAWSASTPMETSTAR